MNKQKCKEGHRICIICKIEKPLTNEFFHKDKNRLSGLMYRCKECDGKRVDRRIYQKRKEKWSEKSRNKYKATQKRYREKPSSLLKSLFRGYERYDKEKGYSTTITLEDLIKVKGKFCSYCGYPSTGFDRLDNSKGHTTENCVPCCRDCNTARMNNFTYEEMKVIGKAIKAVKDKRNILETVIIPLNY